MKRAVAILAVLLMTAPSLRAEDPVFPYGAVYFRKSNPPPEDWSATMPPRRPSG